MNIQQRIRMTASELAMGRVMRAPDHTSGTEGSSGGEASMVVQDVTPAPADNAPDTDNFAAFDKAADDNSFGQVDTPAPGADAEGEKPEAPEGGEEPEGKKGKSAQERIDELTASSREAERRAAELERRLAEMEAGSAKPKAGEGDDTTAAPEGRAEGEPNPDDYVYGEADAQYIKDSAAFAARAEFQRLEAVKALETEFNKIDEGYNARVEKATERYPDFEEKVVKGAQGDNPTWVASPVMALSMKTSEEGPDVAYYLATNPEESHRIAKLSPLEQAREMGRIEGRFAYQEKPKPKLISDAPTPPSQGVRGSGGKFTVGADTDDFAAFDKTYGN